MDITSDMSSALRAGADDGRATQRNGRKRRHAMDDMIKKKDAVEAIAETIADDGDTSAWLYVAEDMLKSVPSADS